jgi:AhpD family alkylhydroperoxidase
VADPWDTRTVPDLVVPVAADHLSPALRDQWAAAEQAGRPGLAEFVRVMANAEPLFILYNQAYGAARFDNHLGVRLTELVRLAVSQTTTCRVCMAGRHSGAVEAGMTEELVAAIPALATSAEGHDGFTDPERAAVRFALKFGTDHLSVDETDRVALREHFDDRQIVELGLLCALCLVGRFSAILGLEEPACPVT